MTCISKGKSFHRNLIFFIDKISNFLDKGKAIDLIHLDFSKAFVMVPHGK